MRSRLLLLATPLALALTACGGPSSDDGSSADAALDVTAAFYPLQWASERVGGDLVDVNSLTKPGAEPHDLELTPKQVGDLASSDVVVYLAGFQPAVDAAVQSEAPDAGFDVSPDADLTLVAGPHGHEHETGDDHDHSDDHDHDHDHDHEDSGHDEHSPDEHGAAEGVDPHFWLDPVRFESVVTAVGERFAAADPDHAADYRANAAEVVTELKSLDEDFRAGLENCRNDDLVTAHTAFGYLAERYGLTQEGITGLSPDVEPDAATLRSLAEYVKEHDVTTIYGETLVSPALAETLARETGATVAVLDPVEGLTDASQGSDYIEVMQHNLTVLEQGQGCGT